MASEPLREPSNADAARPSLDKSLDGASGGPTPLEGPPQNLTETEIKERLDSVLQSDIGVATLLNRLKQSISSARDFAGFLKKRATIEEEHAQRLKRASRDTMEQIRRPENRQGSFAQSYEEITRVHERMSDHGLQFAMALSQMHDELQDLAANVERGRKHWKQSGTNASKRVQESEGALDKAKSRYYSLADQYDRARTGDRQSRGFGIKGPKSAAQQEEDLGRKLQAADADYEGKVQSAQAIRQEMTSSLRPQAVRALQELINECDSGLSLQLQKFATLNEKLLLGNGLCISPLKGQTAGPNAGPRSLREVAQNVNDEKDLQDYVLSFSNKAGSQPPDIKYEKHPSLVSPRQAQQPQFPQQQSYNSSQPQYASQNPSFPNAGYEGQGHRPSQSGQMSGVTPYPPQQRQGSGIYAQPGQYPSGMQNQYQQQGPRNDQMPQLPQLERLSLSNPATSTNSGPQRADTAPMDPNNDYRNVNPAVQSPGQGMGRGGQPSYGPDPGNFQTMPQQGLASNYRNAGGPLGPNPNGGPTAAPNGPPSMAPQDQRSPSQTLKNGYPQQPPSMGYPADDRGPQGPPNGSYRPQAQHPGSSNSISSGPTTAAAAQPRRSDMQGRNLPPLKPVFGVSLEELFRRDNNAVPMIVYQCVQAVDLFGLDVEGIYRTSGSAPHIMEMKAIFDNDSSQVDFRNPAAFHHDIASVTTLLKHFLRDLPDPLLTSAQYNRFIEAAKIEDDTSRRDSLHAIINALPDPNYATLRVLTLHLHRVAQHSQQNRMTPSNLAICFGPTLLGQTNGGGASAGADIRAAGWQARVVETILTNTFQIFDDDD